MKRSLIIEIIGSLLILLFAYTAISKLLDYTAFKYTLSKSPLMDGMSGLVALALPITEGLVAVLLFIPRTRIWGFYSSVALMSVFTLYLAYMINFAPKLPCSCGGVLKQMTWNQHLVFNIFFLAIAVTGLVLERKRVKRKPEDELPSVVFT
ncbi:MAG TPA: MauE/DoxX family redox-associated membrane protein [Chitinophagaceae bacterium]|nr:MauE/DoxX family redox-associated membrane protein [Chitinophagaceae bacterium]